MRDRFSGFVHIALIALAAFAVAFLSTRVGFERDWSYANGASLSTESVALLKTLDGPVEVVSYAGTQGGLRAIISNFIGRYQRAKHDIALRFVDPDADPQAMRARVRETRSSAFENSASLSTLRRSLRSR
jgi:hypothetical protein